MKLLIFGAKGYIGQHFLGIYPHAATPDTDIADAEAVARALDTEKPDVVINCAGKAGHPTVDWCADHKMETIRSNVRGPLVLLDECTKRNIYWVHMSTGCIYEGDNNGRGFSETDPPNFFGSFYSCSKAASDLILKNFPILQLRLRMPFDASSHPRNLITKLKQYAKINAIPNSMTSIPDFLNAAEALIAKHATGTYNIVNPGVLSPYDVMLMYREIVDPEKKFEACIPKNVEGAAKGNRSNCILSMEKLRKEGIHMKPINSAIREALLQYKKSASIRAKI
jgi:3,5-epimerase/4-reductase